MHLTDVTKGAMGSYAIIGAHLPVAAGAAWSAQYRGTEQVAVCFFGDGTTNIGAFHEALNFSVVWKLPVIFVCENNLYMEYTPISARDRGRASGGGPRERLQPRESRGRRQRRRRGLSHGGQIHEPRAQGRRPGADRGHDLPPQRAFARRPGEVPPGRRAREMARARPAQDLPRAAARAGHRRSDAEGHRGRGHAQGGRGDRGGQGLAAAVAGRYREERLGGRRRRHGGTDLSRRGRRRHRAGDGARRERGVPGRGRGARRRRVQGHRRPAREVRPEARARLPDLGAGDPRRGDGRGDDGLEADRRDHVLGFPRGVLGHRRQRDRQDALHDQRPDRAAAGDPHRQRRGLALRRAALAGGGELGDGDARASRWWRRRFPPT